MKRRAILASVLAVTLLTGCGSVTTGDPASATASTNASASAAASTQSAGSSATVNEFGWTIPEKTMEIAYYVGQDNPDTVAKNSAKMAQYLLDNFNVKLTKIVYDTDMVEKLNIMLASNDYPDVISNMSATEAQKWVDLGKAQELTPLIDQYGTELKNQMGDMMKRYQNDEGKIFILPVGWGLLPIADYGAQVRLDWYKEIGSPAFTTTDEYFEVMKQLVAKHPKNEAGEKVYALGTWKDDSIIQQLGGAWGLKAGYKEEADGSLTHWINTPEGLEFTKWYNKFNREGLLDPDSFTQKRDDWMTKCSNERYAGHFANWWVGKDAGNMTWIKTKSNYNDDMRYVHYDLKAPGVAQSTLCPKNTMGWGRTIITDVCKNPEDVMKWINFEASDLGTKLLSWGVPNTETSVWTIDKAGQWAWVEKETTKLLDGSFVWAPFDENGGTSFWLVEGQQQHKDGTFSWFDQNFQSKWFKMKDENLKNAIFDFSAYYAISIPSDSNITIINQQVKDITLAGFANAVMAKTEEECVTRYNAMKDKLKSAGVDELQQFYTENYKKNVAAWK